MRLLYALLFALLAASPALACSNGDRASAYDLGHRLAFRGIDTAPAAEVTKDLRNCFAIGYREGRLQRLLQTNQPHPPARLPVRPRGLRNG